jgi:DNA ligase (NAD+)
LNDPNRSLFIAARGSAAQAAFEGSEARAEIDNIEGFGAVVAETIADFFAGKLNEDVLDALLEHVPPLPMAGVASTSAGKTVVFSGSLGRLTRDEAKSSQGGVRRKRGAKSLFGEQKPDTW